MKQCVQMSAEINRCMPSVAEPYLIATPIGLRQVPIDLGHEKYRKIEGNVQVELRKLRDQVRAQCYWSSLSRCDTFEILESPTHHTL